MLPWLLTHTVSAGGPALVKVFVQPVDCGPTPLLSPPVAAPPGAEPPSSSPIASATTSVMAPPVLIRSRCTRQPPLVLCRTPRRPGACEPTYGWGVWASCRQSSRANRTTERKRAPGRPPAPSFRLAHNRKRPRPALEGH